MNMLQLFKPNPNRRQCCHNNDNGTQCKANPQKGSDYCFFHDPELADERKTASRAGGAANRRTTRQPVDLPDNPLQTLSQIADLLRETLDRARRLEIKSHEATAIGYVATTLVGVMEKEEHQEEKAQRSAAADAFLKTVFPKQTPAAEAAATEQGIEEQVMAEQGMKEQEMKKDPKDELAALLFADDQQFSEPVQPEPTINSKPEQPEPAAAKPQLISPPSKQKEASQDELVWNGASLEFLQVSRAVLEKQNQTENQNESVNKSESVDKIEGVKKSQSVDKNKNVNKNASSSPSNAVSPPSNQDAVRNQANPDEQFSGIPGLQQKHVNYMKFLPLPEATRRKQRRPAFRTASAAMRAEEMKEIAARLKGRGL